MGFVVDKVSLRQGFLGGLRFSLLNILPNPHTHSFIYQQGHMILQIPLSLNNTLPDFLGVQQ